jgi:hypothetical protein
LGDIDVLHAAVITEFWSWSFEFSRVSNFSTSETIQFDRFKPCGRVNGNGRTIIASFDMETGQIAVGPAEKDKKSGRATE